VCDSAEIDLDRRCPCGDDEWQNHGEYVSCVSREAQNLVESGDITEDMKGTLVSERASGCK